MANVARQFVEKGADHLSHSPIVTFEDVEPWQRVNIHIRGKYRRSCGYGQAVASIFWRHNESANIWTHLVALLYFVWNQWWYHPSDNDCFRYALDIFRVCGAFCFGVSCIFHTFLCVSEDDRKFLNKLDYVGILMFLMAGGFAWMTITLHRYLVWRIVYSGLGVAFGCRLLRQILCNDNFRSAEYQTKRAAEFFLFASLICVPFGHSCFVMNNLVVFDGSLFCIVVSFVIGVLFYVTRWPECWWPGEFDMFPSHCFFHICVFWGARLYYLKLYNMVEVTRAG